MILATAITARTKQAYISIALILLPLYDPIRLAEEMAVLDIYQRRPRRPACRHRLCAIRI